MFSFNGNTFFDKFYKSATLELSELIELGKELSEFLKVFFPDPDEIIYISQLKPKESPPLQETYTDKNGKERKKEAEGHWTKQIEITRSQLETDINFIRNIINQSHTRGTYFVVNAGGRKKEQITRINAWFCENDILSLEEQFEQLYKSPLPPSLMIVTKKSIHAYWLVEGECNIEDWNNIQRRLINHFNGDKSLKNPNRLMRLPNFDHIKFVGENVGIDEGDSNEKFLLGEPNKLTDYERKRVELKEIYPNRKYTLNQMQEAFADVVETKVQKESKVIKKKSLFTKNEGFPPWCDELREYFCQNGKPTENGYELRCPCCGDVSEKTGFMYSEGGFKCHKNGCSPREMAEAVGIIKNDPVTEERKMLIEVSENECHETDELRGMNGWDFINTELEYNPPILLGVRRGQIGILNAVAHTGKTIFMLNLSLSLLRGSPFPPFIKDKKPLRVMLIDGESSKQELQFFLRQQTKDWDASEKESAFSNLHLICDDEFNDELVSLSNPEHRDRIEQIALDFKPDLIIIDTVSALFNMKNENDNAEIKKDVMTPLKNLAKRTKSAVIMNHHIGKMSEDSNASNKVYSGRGGSAFGSLSRTVITLTKDKLDKNKVIFAMPKIKGEQIEDLTLELNRESFWFSVKDEVPQNVIPLYNHLLNLIDKEMSTKEIVSLASKLGISESSVEKTLANAVSRNDIKKIRRGVYSPLSLEATNDIKPIDHDDFTACHLDLGLTP